MKGKQLKKLIILSSSKDGRKRGECGGEGKELPLRTIFVIFAKTPKFHVPTCVIHNCVDGKG